MDKPIIPSMPEPVRKPEAAIDLGRVGAHPNPLMHDRATPYTDRIYGEPHPQSSPDHSIHSNSSLKHTDSPDHAPVEKDSFKGYRKRYDFNQALDKDIKIRESLAKELGVSVFDLYSDKINKAVADIKDKFPKQFGDIIDERELQRLENTVEEQQHNSEEVDDHQGKATSGFTKRELVDMKQREIVWKFFRRLLGLKEH